MKQKILIYNPRGLYGKLLSRLSELETEIKGLPKDGFLPYSYVREKLGRNFSIKRGEVMELIFFLRDIGFLEISRIGIKVCYKIENGK